MQTAEQTQVRLTIDMNSIHIVVPESEMFMNTHEVYKKIQQLYAKEDIRNYLLDEGYAASEIDALVDEAFVERWLECISNNAVIAEAKQIAASDLAMVLTHKEGR